MRASLKSCSNKVTCILALLGLVINLGSCSTLDELNVSLCFIFTVNASIPYCNHYTSKRYLFTGRVYLWRCALTQVKCHPPLQSAQKILITFLIKDTTVSASLPRGQYYQQALTCGLLVGTKDEICLKLSWTKAKISRKDLRGKDYILQYHPQLLSQYMNSMMMNSINSSKLLEKENGL